VVVDGDVETEGSPYVVVVVVEGVDVVKGLVITQMEEVPQTDPHGTTQTGPIIIAAERHRGLAPDRWMHLLQHIKECESWHWVNFHGLYCNGETMEMEMREEWEWLRMLFQFAPSVC